MCKRPQRQQSKEHRRILVLATWLCSHPCPLTCIYPSWPFGDHEIPEVGGKHSSTPVRNKPLLFLCNMDFVCCLVKEEGLTLKFSGICYYLNRQIFNQVLASLHLLFLNYFGLHLGEGDRKAFCSCRKFACHQSNCTVETATPTLLCLLNASILV